MISDGPYRNPTARILLAGAFGQGNPGDESVLEAFVAGLEGCDLAATSSLAPEPGDPERGDPETRRYRPVHPGNRLRVAREALAADLVVMTATVLKRLHPSSGRHPNELLMNSLAMAVACRAAGRPVALAGVGAGALGTVSARLLARAVASAAGAVMVRDEESAQVLRQAGFGGELGVEADVVWSVLPEPRVPPARRDGPVVVALSHLAGGLRLRRSLVEGLRRLLEEGHPIALQPWQAGPDGDLARELSDLLGSGVALWPPPRDVPDAAVSLAGARVVLGLRFHSLVAAAAAGVPFAAVAHEPKLAALARRLGQIAVDPAGTGTELAAAVRAALAAEPPSAIAIQREKEAAARVIQGCRDLAVARTRGVRMAPAHVPVWPATPGTRP